MKAAELLVACLENEGVDYIFDIPGEKNMDFLEALRASRISRVTSKSLTTIGKASPR